MEPRRKSPTWASSSKSLGAVVVPRSAQGIGHGPSLVCSISTMHYRLSEVLRSVD